MTEAQMQLFYDQNEDRLSGDFTQTKDAIRQYLEQIEVRQAERALVEKLRAAASIQVFLPARNRQNPNDPVNAVGSTSESSRTQTPLLGSPQLIGVIDG